jgi:hypothetical protein
MYVCVNTLYTPIHTIYTQHGNSFCYKASVFCTTVTKLKVERLELIPMRTISLCQPNHNLCFAAPLRNAHLACSPCWPNSHAMHERLAVEEI